MELVTGATGIVGTHLLFELAQRGEVVAIYREGTDRTIVEKVFRHYSSDASSLLARIHWREADITDMDALSEAMTGITHVYHTAAVVSFDPKDRGAMDRVNIGGTANVVNGALAAGVKRICQVSSIAAIGRASAGVERTETTPWEAEKHTSAYALSKYEAEMEIYRGIAEGVEAVIVNPCIILGPGASGRSSITLVERLRKGTRFYPPGTNAVVDARDVATCMVQLMEKGGNGERYILVGENLPYHRLFKLITSAFGKPEPTMALQPWMLGLGWRFERIRSLLTGSNPLITQATVASSLLSRSYSSVKVKALLGHPFRTAEEAINNVVKYLEGNTDR